MPTGQEKYLPGTVIVVASVARPEDIHVITRFVVRPVVKEEGLHFVNMPVITTHSDGQNCPFSICAIFSYVKRNVVL